MVFGSPLQPVYYLVFRGLPFPLWIITASILAGGAAGFFAAKNIRQAGIAQYFGRPLAFGAVSSFVAVLIASLVTGTIRETKRSELSPDAYESQSLIVSFRTAPSGFDLHAVALKDCKPYAWSYGEMDFYPLDNQNISVNVIPREWAQQCSIERTR